MYEKGHTGIALLACIPAVMYLDSLVLQIVFIGVAVLASRLPDLDLETPFLGHRGYSHNVFTAVGLSIVLYLSTSINPVLTLVFGVVFVVGVDTPSFDIPVWRKYNVLQATVFAVTATYLVQELYLARYTAGTIGTASMAASILSLAMLTGYLSHLVGDAITIHSYKPFKPVSDVKTDIQLTSADSILYNNLFFYLGAFLISVYLLDSHGFDVFEPVLNQL